MRSKLASESLVSGNKEGQVELSVVICSRNRAGLLAQAVATLVHQSFDTRRYEILVVDDSSTDETPELGRHLAKTHPQVRYILSDGRGLLHARVTGQSRSRGRYIAYLDDDAQACPDWLSCATRIIEERSPVCFGGPFFPFYMSKKPRWYRDEYGSMTHGTEARELNNDEYLCGNNIFFETEALRASGGFDVGFCEPEARWTYGDETLPQLRLQQAYPARKFLYEPALSISHLVRPERLNIVRAARECFAMGQAYVRLTGVQTRERRTFPFARRFVHSYLRFWFCTLVAVWFRDRRRFTHPQNYVYEIAFQHLRRAAVFYRTAREVHARTRRDRVTS